MKSLKYIYYLLSLVLITLFSQCSTPHLPVKKMPLITVKNHSYSNYDSVTLKHLHLQLEVNFEKKTLQGKAILDISNHSGTPFLILDTKDLEIEKVLLEDKENTAYSFTDEQEHIGKGLVIEIKKETKQVYIYYETSPKAEALMWLEPEQTAGKKQPFMFTQSQAILARTWIPCMDAPAVKFTYSADIACQNQYLPLMSAQNNPTKNNEGKYHFEMKQPIPSYLLALAVGNLSFKNLGENCGVYAEPEILEKSAFEFSSLPQMIKGAEELYGKYAWGRYDVLVLPPSFPFGGMENPKLTFATPTIIAGDKSLVSLIAHELAHSWSGNLVTNRTWDDFWLNEGFTVYFEERIMEKLYGKDYADMLAELSLGELQLTLKDLMINAPGDTKLKLNLKGRNPDDGVSDIAYIKGCMFLKLIENSVGRTEWDKFLLEYFNEFKWKTITTEEFIEYLNSKLLKKHPQLKLNINEWVYEIGLPKNCPKINSKELIKISNLASQINLTKDINKIDTTGFTTHHWLHFLRQLNPDSVKLKMGDIQKKFSLNESTNAEIQCDWYLLSIKTNYETAFPFIDTYLNSVGRRKFLKPIYEEFSKTEKGLNFAKQIYQKAEPSYHAVSRNTIREILKLEKSN